MMVFTEKLESLIKENRGLSQNKRPYFDLRDLPR